MTGDDLANRVVIELHRDRKKIVIEPGTTIIGYATKNDGVTEEIEGYVDEEGNAVVDIPGRAYSTDGPITISVRMLDGDKKMVIGSFDSFVRKTQTDQMIE